METKLTAPPRLTGGIKETREIITLMTILGGLAAQMKGGGQELYAQDVNI
jgi:hypothetical protein